jgi:predicted dehydrogenase
MIRIGLTGIGFMGMTHYRAYQKIRGARVVAICEADPTRRNGDWRSIKGNFGQSGTVMDLTDVARYATIEEMLEDSPIDLVDICLPTPLHCDAASAALQAGKNVLCEKPIALNSADARKMLSAAQQAKRLLLIGHVLPYMPEYAFAYQVIHSGKYGRLLGGHFKRIISVPTWMPHYFDPQKFGGPVFDLHIHDAHFIRLVCGMPRKLQTVGRMRGEVLEHFSTQFLFDDPTLYVTATSGVIDQQGRPFAQGFEICLEKATLYFDFAALADGTNTHTPLTVLTDNGKIIRPKLGGGDPSAAFAGELSDVVRAVRDQRAPAPLSGELACDAVTLCSKQTESARRGRPVTI